MRYKRLKNEISEDNILRKKKKVNLKGNGIRSE